MKYFHSACKILKKKSFITITWGILNAFKVFDEIQPMIWLDVMIWGIFKMLNWVWREGSLKLELCANQPFPSNLGDWLVTDNEIVMVFYSALHSAQFFSVKQWESQAKWDYLN